VAAAAAVLAGTRVSAALEAHRLPLAVRGRLAAAVAAAAAAGRDVLATAKAAVAVAASAF
jgi:hypothetical protein